jgi:hypothetical protein
MSKTNSRSRWDDPERKSLNPSEEHAMLGKLEISSGHSWERTSFGEIKFYRMENRCEGPICRECGFGFCLGCGDTDAMTSCTGAQSDITELSSSGPSE